MSDGSVALLKKRVRHRVFCRYLGRIGFVNMFPTAAEAARLVMMLRARYGDLGASFWHTPERQDGTATWQMMKALLRAREPMRLPMPRRPADIGITGNRSITSNTEIDAYLAGGGAISILPTRNAKGVNPTPVTKKHTSRSTRRARRSSSRARTRKAR